MRRFKGSEWIGSAGRRRRRGNPDAAVGRVRSENINGVSARGVGLKSSTFPLVCSVYWRGGGGEQRGISAVDPLEGEKRKEQCREFREWLATPIHSSRSRVCGRPAGEKIQVRAKNEKKKKNSTRSYMFVSACALLAWNVFIRGNLFVLVSHYRHGFAWRNVLGQQHLLRSPLRIPQTFPRVLAHPPPTPPTTTSC